MPFFAVFLIVPMATNNLCSSWLTTRDFPAMVTIQLIQGLAAQTLQPLVFGLLAGGPDALCPSEQENCVPGRACGCSAKPGQGESGCKRRQAQGCGDVSHVTQPGRILLVRWLPRAGVERIACEGGKRKVVLAADRTW